MDAIPFRKSTMLAWRMLAREHDRAVQEFFMTVMAEQGLSPSDYSPNVTTMQYEPNAPRPSNGTAEHNGDGVDDLKAALKKRAGRVTGNNTR